MVGGALYAKSVAMLHVGNDKQFREVYITSVTRKGDLCLKTRSYHLFTTQRFDLFVDQRPCGPERSPPLNQLVIPAKAGIQLALS